MKKELVKKEEIQNSDWYQSLIEDCQGIITEAVFTSRWSLVAGYWGLGKRIREDNNNFERNKIYGKKIVQGLGESLNISTSTLYYALQAYDKYPNLDLIPDGKNISWNKLITKYLPEPKKETPILPEGKYQVIYADPPWTYRNIGVEGAVDKKYPTMTIEELSQMPIKNLTTENAVLFLWITNPILEEGFELIKNWGFQYKTNIAWIKQNKKTGIGFYVRGIHELLLICIKGQMLPKYTPLSVIKADSKEHSRKPEIYDLIEKMYPNQKYLELFARNNKKREDWGFWGDQAI